MNKIQLHYSAARFSSHSPDRLFQDIFDCIIKKIFSDWSHYQVYQDIQGKPEVREFNSVLTSSDMIEQQRLSTKPIQYYRIPIDDHHAPKEEVCSTII